jgi:CDGSH-type Zn-finger protein
VLARPDVFVPNVSGDWIYPDRASTADVAELAHNCPSGAIRYETKDGSPNESAPLVNRVRVRENGPLAFHASIDIPGTELRYRATLCRCGASSQKPFCDGSHVASQFHATGEPMAQTSEALPKRDGTLKIDLIKNGPLHVTGALEILTGTGHTVVRTEDTWLCRCGHSANKPYCDGSHSKKGFIADASAPKDA